MVCWVILMAALQKNAKNCTRCIPYMSSSWNIKGEHQALELYSSHLPITNEKTSATRQSLIQDDDLDGTQHMISMIIRKTWVTRHIAIQPRSSVREMVPEICVFLQLPSGKPTMDITISRRDIYRPDISHSYSDGTTNSYFFMGL